MSTAPKMAQYLILEVAPGGGGDLAAFEAKIGSPFADTTGGKAVWFGAQTPAGGSKRAFLLRDHEHAHFSSIASGLSSPAINLSVGPIARKQFSLMGPGTAEWPGLKDALFVPTGLSSAFTKALKADRAVGTTASITNEAGEKDVTKTYSKIPRIQSAYDGARTDAATTERERCRTIMTSAEAAGREDLARHMALNTDVSADAAIAALSASPKRAPAAAHAQRGGATFEMAMDRTRNPQVGGDVAGGGGQHHAEDGSDVLALARAAGLHGFKSADASR